MKVKVLLALVTAVSNWMVSFRDESNMVPRSLAKITRSRGMEDPLSFRIRRGLEAINQYVDVDFVTHLGAFRPAQASTAKGQPGCSSSARNSFRISFHQQRGGKVANCIVYIDNNYQEQ